MATALALVNASGHAQFCGDGICEFPENEFDCPFDCGYCGDGFCSLNEDFISCPSDCGYCGDGYCTGGETPEDCQVDCGFCGDGICDPWYEEEYCFDDCPGVCGDGICSFDESLASCPEDCGYCGDGICATNEDGTDCPDDCTTCGDNVCDPSEVESCLDDCGFQCQDVVTRCSSNSSFTGFDLNPVYIDSDSYVVLEVFATFALEPGAPAPKVLGVEDATVIFAVGFIQNDATPKGHWNPFWSLDIPGLSDSSRDSFVTIGFLEDSRTMVDLDQTFLDDNDGEGAFIPQGAGWFHNDGGIAATPYSDIEWTYPSLGGYYGKDTMTHAVKVGQFTFYEPFLQAGLGFYFEGNVRFEADGPGSQETSRGVLAFPDCFGCTVTCPADLDGDGEVGGSDIAILLAQWGEQGDADLDGNGFVDGPDLTIVLANWGACSESP